MRATPTRTRAGTARRAVAAVGAVAALAGACSNDVSGVRTPPGREGRNGPVVIDTKLISSLESFTECDDLLAYLRTEGAKVVGPYGFSGDGGYSVLAEGRTTASGRDVAAPTAGDMEQSGTAAPATTAMAASPEATGGPEFSGTNVQEEGVDEPDLVKTDGKRLVTIGAGQLRVLDLTGGSPRLAGSLRLDDSTSGPEYVPYLSGQLLLSGDRVLVLHQAPPVAVTPLPRPMPAPGSSKGDEIGISPSPGVPYQPGSPRTRVTVVDISDAAAPRVTDEVNIDGDLVASRMVGGVARLVLRSGPPNLPLLYPSGSEASVGVATEANKLVVAESTLEDWLPRFDVKGASAAPQRLTDCRDVKRPEVFSGLGMLSVVTLDALDPRPGPAATVIGAGETVYASAANLYVTSTAWNGPEPTGRQQGAAVPDTTIPQPATQPDIATDVHKFGIADKVRTTYAGSGRVKGRLLNSFSMSEHDGDLRVATTDDAVQESAVVVLRQKDEVLEQIGGVGGLGKTERIYAVRFLGTRGYVVTFRQTDPLYVLDLSDPAKPAVRGELKIPGYSAYLHPVGHDRLIGVGQDATDQGRVQGTQVSLFDVSDPADPKRLANRVLPATNSEAESDHHAFLYWPKTRLTVIPVQSHRDGRTTAAGFTITDDEVAEVGRIDHRDQSQIRRSLVVGDRVLTVSDSGVRSSDLTTLAERGWVAF